MERPAREFNRAAYRIARSLSPGRRGEYGGVAYPDAKAMLRQLMQDGRVEESELPKLDAEEFRRRIAAHPDIHLRDWLRSWNNFT